MLDKKEIDIQNGNLAPAFKYIYLARQEKNLQSTCSEYAWEKTTNRCCFWYLSSIFYTYIYFYLHIFITLAQVIYCKAGVKHCFSI